MVYISWELANFLIGAEIPFDDGFINSCYSSGAKGQTVPLIKLRRISATQKAKGTAYGVSQQDSGPKVTDFEIST